MIRICEIDIMFIKCSSTYIGIRKHEILRNWFRYETFIHLFALKVFFSTRWERDTIFLCWPLLHRQLSTQPTRSARSAHRRLASTSSESQPSSSEVGTQLTAFSQISAHASGAWRHPNTLVSIPIRDFYFDIFKWHILSVRAWTPALMLHLTKPCAKRKVLSLTKPKGKIYKTKSLRYYITLLQPRNGRNAINFRADVLRTTIWSKMHWSAWYQKLKPA